MNKINILITGALGHIGSHLIRSLGNSDNYSNIYLVDNLRTNRYFSLFNLSPDYKFKFLDIDVREGLESSILNNIDYVIHLAALTEPSLSAKSPEMFISYNESCTNNLVKFCIKRNARLIFVSSTSVYSKSGVNLTESCDESYLCGQTPYARCKLLEEKLVKDSSCNDGLKYTILRFGTIYGVSPGMRFHTAVNKFCWEASLDKPISVWKTAFEQIRPYLDIKDASNALVHCMNSKISAAEIYNVATNNSSVKEIIDIIKYFKPNVSLDTVNSPIMNDLSYSLCTQKFCNTGFKFKGSLENSIKSTLSLFEGISPYQFKE